VADGWPARLCSDECARAHRNRKARERRAPDPRDCKHCGETFQPNLDARYCSGGCRVAAHRARRQDGAEGAARSGKPLGNRWESQG